MWCEWDGNNRSTIFVVVAVMVLSISQKKKKIENENKKKMLLKTCADYLITAVNEAVVTQGHFLFDSILP